MNDKEIEEMLEELYKQRLVDKNIVLHHTKPKSHKTGGYKAVVNFDFASLYPSVQKSYKMNTEFTAIRRRISIKKIFNQPIAI